MSEKKAIKQDAKAIWTAVRDNRRARAKLVGAADLAESAKLLAAGAEALAELARRAEAIAVATAPDLSKPDPTALIQTKRRRSKKNAGA